MSPKCNMTPTLVNARQSRRSLFLRRHIIQTAVPILLALATIVGCSSPADRVARDVRLLIEQDFGGRATVKILDSGPGEGDSDNVYYVVNIVVIAKQDVAAATGTFSGVSLKTGETSEPIRLEMLYQWYDGAWRLRSTRRVRDG